MPVPRIYLTGFMGSGKSTVGPLVADQLGYRFVDMDERVEAVAGRPISALFTERGEATFRALETAVLAQVVGEDRVVIATGGGALSSDGTMAMAKEDGCVVYLRVSPETLYQRLRASVGRPMLLGEDGKALDGPSLQERISAILDRRLRYYEQADAVIDAEHSTPPDVAAATVRAVMDHVPA